MGIGRAQVFPFWNQHFSRKIYLAQVKRRTDALAEKRGAELEAASIEHVTRQLATFKAKLEMFAKVFQVTLCTLRVLLAGAP